MDPGGVDPVVLRDLAVVVASAAADLLRSSRPDPAAISTKSSATDLVTDRDRAAEALIVARLLAERPADGVLGEEGGERSGTSGVRWVIDPLDGTTNYVYDQPAHAVAVAAEVDGAAVAGVVVDVTRRECFAAARGRGATLDGRRLRVNDVGDLATALLGTGFSYDPEVRRAQAEVLTTVLPAVRDLRRSGSAALDLCALAAGRLDGFWERGLAHWDHAAAGLVATEAGARVGWLEEEGPETIVAAPAALFSPLVHLLRAAGA